MISKDNDGGSDMKKLNRRAQWTDLGLGPLFRYSHVVDLFNSEKKTGYLTSRRGLQIPVPYFREPRLGVFFNLVTLAAGVNEIPFI